MFVNNVEIDIIFKEFIGTITMALDICVLFITIKKCNNNKSKHWISTSIIK